MSLISSGARRYLRTSATTAAFFATMVGTFPVGTAGFTLDADGALAVSSAATTITTQGRVILLPEDFRGLRLFPFGKGADNDTFDYRVFAATLRFDPTAAATLNPMTPQSANAANEVQFSYIGGGTCTLGTTLGRSGGTITETERVGDGITWTASTTATTPKGPMAVWEAAYALGTSGAYSPADNSQAHVLIPDLGGACGFLIDIDLTGTTTEANFLYEFLG